MVSSFDQILLYYPILLGKGIRRDEKIQRHATYNRKLANVGTKIANRKKFKTELKKSVTPSSVVPAKTTVFFHPVKKHQRVVLWL